MTKHRTSLLLLSFLLVLLPFKAANADLTLTPIRVVFEGRNRSAEVQLVNVTNRTNTYRVGWMEMQKTAKGNYVLMPVKDNKNPHSVSNMVIFTPRQVTIAPHGQQTIRLSLRRPADLPFGEYRAHMSLTRLANMGPERNDPKAKTVEMALQVNLGFSIPVIVRSGDDKDLKIAIQSPKLGLGGTGKQLQPQLSFDVVRTAGTFSSYGFAKIYWTPARGSEHEIGGFGNLALYPEVKSRHIVAPLKETPTDGTLRIVYKGKYESEGTTWDEKTFPIGK